MNTDLKIDTSTEIRRRRVLVSAHLMSPGYGSELGTGWNIATRLARWHDTTVLCCPYQLDFFGRGKHWDARAEIRAHLREHGEIENLTIQFVEPPRLSRMFQRESFPMRELTYYFGYAAWQRAAYRLALEQHLKQRFELAHQITITGFREPGYLWKLDCPFVWGPITGASSMPWPYLKILSTREALIYGARRIVNEHQKRRSSRVRQAADRATNIWAASEADRAMVSGIWGKVAELIPDTGTEVRPDPPQRRYVPPEPLRLCWSGLHIGRKALPLLLNALAKFDCPGKIELSVLGQGPETARWKALARSLKVDSYIRWTGHLGRAAALAEMDKAHVLVLTSVQEGNPAVMMEALSSGMPVVCHDACGMAHAVTGECGVKIPLRNPASSVEGFAEALQRFLDVPNLIAALSAGAACRARELSWDKKAKQFAAAYDRILSAGESERFNPRAHAGALDV